MFKYVGNNSPRKFSTPAAKAKLAKSMAQPIINQGNMNQPMWKMQMGQDDRRGCFGCYTDIEGLGICSRQCCDRLECTEVTQARHRRIIAFWHLQEAPRAQFFHLAPEDLA